MFLLMFSYLLAEEEEEEEMKKERKFQSCTSFFTRLSLSLLLHVLHPLKLLHGIAIILITTYVQNLFDIPRMFAIFKYTPPV